MDKYEKRLDKADICQKFETTSGDCISIANAIKDLFGGEILAVSNREGVKTIEHAVVRINGNLYDGRGKVSSNRVVSEFSKSNPFDKERLLWTPSSKQLNRFKGARYEAVKEELKEID